MGEVLDLSALVDGGVAFSVVVEIEGQAWLDIEFVRVPGSEMPLLIEDVVGDSESQQYEAFSTGLSSSERARCAAGCWRSYR